jgi:DNA-binding transcriptional LysR family regulator
MDLDAIAVFVKVVETGSFSGAARLLKMPKTTVSAKVAALEKRLGVILIHRTTRKLFVTEAGEQYFHHCANAVREIELGESALQYSQGVPSGLLKVTAPVDFGHTLLPKIVHAYLEKYPGTSVELLLVNRTVDLVGEGVDLAIRAGRLKDSSLIAKRFFAIETNLWAAPAYLAEAGTPRQPSDLARHRLLALSSMTSTTLGKGKQSVAIAINSRVLTDDFEVVKAMIMLGAGIGWLPDFHITDAQAAGTLVQVLPEWKTEVAGGFNFVYPGSRYASPKVQAFIATAVELMGEGGPAAAL